MTQAVAARDVPRMTVQEFLEWDDGTAAHYELIDGRPVAMTPPLRAHGDLLIALGAELRGALRGRCRVTGQAGIRVPGRDDVYYEADLAVECQGTPHPRWVDAPVLIVEVLSPSTAVHDRGQKAFDYRSIPSVHEVLFLFTSAVRAEIWRRVGDHWQIEDLIGRDAALRLDSVDVAMPLGAVYENIPLEGSEPMLGGEDGVRHEPERK